MSPQGSIRTTTGIIVLTFITAIIGYAIWREMGQMEVYAPSNTAMYHTPAHMPVVLTPSPTPTTSIDTSNWKTYRNEEYEFEVKYPESAQVEPDEMTGDVTFHGLGIRLSPDNRSPIEVLGPTLCKKSETIMIDFRKASKADCEIEGRKHIIVVVNIDHPIYHRLSFDFTKPYFYNYSNQISDDEQALQAQTVRIFNQILSTFKFIK